MPQIQMTSWGGIDQPSREAPPAKITDPLGQLIAAIVESLDVGDANGGKEFRATLNRMTRGTPDDLPPSEKLKVVQTVVHELGGYRERRENATRESLVAWRELVAMLLHEVNAALGEAPADKQSASLAEKISTLSDPEDVNAFRQSVASHIQTIHLKQESAKNTELNTVDLSVANDNAAGLRGGGAAVAHVQKILEASKAGFVAVFQLSCLTMIGERFGPTAVQDCLMAVSAFLTHSLDSSDAIYHWNDSTLMVVLEGRHSERIVTAELQRIVSQNRDITITISARTVLLRIPLAFELTPILSFTRAEDLYEISDVRATKW